MISATFPVPSMLHATYRGAKRVAVFVVGATLLLFGVLLLVLPGPGLLVILLGLVVLGTEFLWARRWLRRLRTTTRRAGRRARASRWWPRKGARDKP